MMSYLNECFFFNLSYISVMCVSFLYMCCKTYFYDHYNFSGDGTINSCVSGLEANPYIKHDSNPMFDHDSRDLLRNNKHKIYQGIDFGFAWIDNSNV